MSTVSPIDGKREVKPRATPKNPLVDQLLDEADVRDMVFIPKLFVAFTGSLAAAAMLNQLLYWHDKGQLADNWTYKSDAMWSEELCIKKYAVAEARKVLTSMGLIRTKVRRAPNGTPMHHYQCNLPQLRRLWAQFLKNQNGWAEEGKDSGRVEPAA